MSFCSWPGPCLPCVLHSFKYDAALLKERLQAKRATGKVVGGYAQTRARLDHEIRLAQQEGRSEDEVQR